MAKTQLQEFAEEAEVQASEAAAHKRRTEGSGLSVKQVHHQFEILRDYKIDYNTKKAAADAADARVKAQIEHLRDIAEADGLTGRVKVKQEDGSTHIFEVPEPTWYAVIQDWPSFKRWALKNRESMIQDNTRVTKAMNELVREYRDDGRPLPPGLGAAPRPTVKVFGIKEPKE